jgi:hypothetical protein
MTGADVEIVVFRACRTIPPLHESSDQTGGLMNLARLAFRACWGCEMPSYCSSRAVELCAFPFLSSRPLKLGRSPTTPFCFCGGLACIVQCADNDGAEGMSLLLFLLLLSALFSDSQCGRRYGNLVSRAYQQAQFPWFGRWTAWKR